MINENTDNPQIDILNSILQAAALNDPHGFKQFLKYAERPDELQRLFTHRKIKAKALQIKKEIDRRIEIQKENLESKPVLFLKKQENLFVLAEEETKNNLDFSIRWLRDILEDPNASVEDKEYALDQLKKIYDILKIKDKPNSEEKAKKNILEKILKLRATVEGILEWVKKNPKLLIIDALSLIAVILAYENSNISAIVPDIIEDSLIGGLLAMEWQKLQSQYLKDKYGKEINYSKLKAFLLGAAFSMWL